MRALPGFCGGVVDVKGRGVLRVTVDNIDCVCILPFKVTTGAPLLDRKQNTYLRKKTLDVHLIKRTEGVVSCEEAKNCDLWSTTHCDVFRIPDFPQDSCLPKL